MGKEKLKEEEECFKIFIDYNLNKGIKIVKCENLSEKNADPPDYSVCILGVEYAVEITSTGVKKPTIFNDGDNVLYNTYINSYIKMICNIQKKTMEENNLQGLYVVHFFKPIANFAVYKNIEKILKEKLTELIINTKTIPSFDKHVISIENKKVCGVSKLPYSENEIKQGVECGFSDFAWLRSPETVDQLTKLIQCAIDIKENKLKKIVNPKILIIRNTFVFADEILYNKYKLKIDIR